MILPSSAASAAFDGLIRSDRNQQLTDGRGEGFFERRCQALVMRVRFATPPSINCRRFRLTAEEDFVYMATVFIR